LEGEISMNTYNNLIFQAVDLTKGENTVRASALIPENGYYQLDFRHLSLKGRTKLQLFINDECYGDVFSSTTTELTNIPMCTTFLKAGTNTILLKGDQDHIQIDSLLIYSAPAATAHHSAFNLVNPDAMPACKVLMSYFQGIYGHQIVTGQHTAAAHGPELDYIRSLTGKQPAIRGFDFLSYSSATETLNPTDHKIEEVNGNRGSTEQAIEWFTQHNGIVTFCWHWYAPLGGNDKSFYTKHTNFDLNAALIEGSEGYAALLTDMDLIALELMKLRDAGVPVLWRPLHEADGGWFWWGAHGSDAFKKLYYWMYDRYTNHHQLNNLIWVWNARKADWYPGDKVVDINGVDYYSPEGNHGPLRCSFDEEVTVTGHRKPIALTENGPILDPDKLIETHTSWLWFMIWNGEFVMNGKATSSARFKKVYEHPYCVTLDQLPKFN
jgi:mannan endo-1,4-beta-mannosidase